MRVTAPRSLGITTACLLSLAGSPLALRGQSEALGLSEVLELHRHGVSTHQILRSARAHCIAFAVSDSIERDLAAAGVDSSLADGLRRSCVVKPPQPLPPGVLLDDDFKLIGRFAATDQLCVVRPDPRGMRIENRRPDGGCAITYPAEFSGENVRLELSVADFGGEAHTVVALGFGKDGLSWDQYTFAITAAGYVELGRTIHGRFRRLRYQHVPALRTGLSFVNTMGVEIRARTIDLYINDTPVLTYVADRDFARGVSLGLGARSTAVFTRLRMTEHGRVTSRP